MFSPTVESQPFVMRLLAALSWSRVGKTAPWTSGSFASWSAGTALRAVRSS
jgi:hypothetical protein